MNKADNENRDLRRLLRDLVALATTPAAWVGRAPAQIAESVADLLLHTLRADAVYICLRSQNSIEVVRDGQRPGFAEEARTLLSNSVPGSLYVDTITSPKWPISLKVAVQPIGISGEDGFIVIGCADAEFPSEAENLLLSVGANQAAVALRAARLRAEADSERNRLRDLLAQAPAAMGLLMGPEHRWTYVNDEYVRLTGRNDPDDFLGKSVVESLPEIRTQGFIELLDEVYRTGKPFFGREMKTNLERSAKGLSNESYWDFVYQPVRDAVGHVDGILVHAVEVTDRVLARKNIEESERKYRDLAESATIALHWVGADGTILWANKAELEMLGYTAEEYIGHKITEFHLDSPVINDILNRLCRGEKLREYQARLQAKDGSIRHVIIDSSVLFENGKFIHTRCFTRDITERKLAEQRLQQSEARFRAIVETTPECVKLVARDGTLLHMNSAGLSMVEAERAEMVVGKSVYDLIAPEDCLRFREFNERICQGERGSLEFDLLGLKGTRRHMETHAAPLQNPDESLVQLAVTRDVTERKNAEMALRESEQKLRVVTDATPVMIWMSGTDKLCYYFNKSWLDFVGRALEQEMGNGWAENVHPDDFDRCLQIYVSSFDARQPFEMEYRLRHHTGEYRWILDHGVPRHGPDGTFEGYVGGCLDIHDQKEASQARSRLAAIVESSDEAIISKDLNGLVTSWNRQAERLFGYTEQEMIGRSILTIIPPELHRDEDMILSKIRNGEKIDHFETVRVAKSGERIEVSISISPVRDENGRVVGAAKIARDIRESKKIERTLRTTEKLAAAGRLAATVAHEINNPLEAVANLVYLAKRDVRDAEKVASYLNSAKQELNRVAHITRQTLGFYRDTSSPVRFNVASTLDDVLGLYERRFETRNIRVVKQYDDDAEIVALAGEIRQAFSNLLTNALDAMPSAGTLSLRIHKSHKWDNAHAPGVRIVIADSGSGISPEHKQNLFQPFFTTKADVGTGLGLWITRGIIEKHGGSIRARSRTGQKHGTTFSMFLPGVPKHSREQAQLGTQPEHELVAGD